MPTCDTSAAANAIRRIVPGDIAPEFTDIGSSVTLDLGARYRLENSRGVPELYVNVANVADRDPPLMPSSALVGGQTNVGLYDTIGRYLHGGYPRTVLKIGCWQRGWWNRPRCWNVDPDPLT